MRTPASHSRRSTANSVQICSSPYVSPKKNAPNAIQNMIIAVDPGSGAAGSNAPARNSTANIATIITGDPANTATDSRLCTNSAVVRRVSSAHWRTAPTRGGRCATGVGIRSADGTCADRSARFPSATAAYTSSAVSAPNAPSSASGAPTNATAPPGDRNTT